MKQENSQDPTILVRGSMQFGGGMLKMNIAALLSGIDDTSKLADECY
jgi:hypothetical protein